VKYPRATSIDSLPFDDCPHTLIIEYYE
jgi:hypothetical protein